MGRDGVVGVRGGSREFGVKGDTCGLKVKGWGAGLGGDKNCSDKTKTNLDHSEPLPGVFEREGGGGGGGERERERERSDTKCHNMHTIPESYVTQPKIHNTKYLIIYQQRKSE